MYMYLSTFYSVPFYTLELGVKFRTYTYVFVCTCELGYDY